MRVFFFGAFLGELKYLLLISRGITSLGSLQLLSLATTSTTATEGGVEGKVDVLGRVDTDDERGNVDGLLTDANVSLADEDTGVVDSLGKTHLVNLGLETTLKEILSAEGKNVIELGSGLIEHTDALEATDQSGTLENTTGVLLLKGKELTSGLTDVGKSVVNSPHLTLGLEAKLSAELQLGVLTLLLIRATGGGNGLAVYNSQQKWGAGKYEGPPFFLFL
jgi:hypothetical protein